MAKTIEEYAREIAASYGFDEERASTFTAYAKKVAEMDPLQEGEAMASKALPVPFARLLLTARQMEIRGEPLSDDEAAPDYSGNRAAADELEKAGKKELAAIHRTAIAAAEASDKAGSDE